MAGFTCVAMRCLGVVLLQFSSLDNMCWGAVFSGCGLAVTIFEPMLTQMKACDGKIWGWQIWSADRGGRYGDEAGGVLISGTRPALNLPLLRRASV